MINTLKQMDSTTDELRVFRLEVAGSITWLNQAHQTNFLVWEWRDHWELMTAEADITRLDHEILIHQHLGQIPCDSRFSTLNLPNGLALVVIPITGTPRRRILAGIVSQSCIDYFPDVLRLLIKQKRQNRLLTEQHRLLEYYANDLSQNFVELSWFSTLIENMAFNEIDGKLTSAAREALGGLQEFIKAESLTIVLSDQIAQSDLAGYKRIFNLGKQELDVEKIGQLLRLAGPNYFCESYVNNFVAAEPSFLGGEIHSVVITPALCHHRCFGWLIAVNCEQREHDLEWMNSSEQSNAKFTTRSMVLMEAAASVLATHAHNLQLLNEQQTLLIGTVRSLVNTLDAKDKYTCGHSDRVAQIAKCIAREYGLPEQDCQRIYLAGLLHDIGKIGVRDEVLQKTGVLTPEEYDEIKLHPVFGYEILKHLHQLQHVLPGVMHHHESWDGTGYPHQLKDAEIPLAARILAVADAYDAMTSHRPYRKGMAPRQAEAILVQGSGKQWDPDAVAAFFRVLPKIQNIICDKQKRSYLPVKQSEYVFDDDLFECEDQVLSAILTTTCLSDVAK